MKSYYVIKNDFDCGLEPVLRPQSAPHLFEHERLPQCVAPTNRTAECRFRRLLSVILGVLPGACERALSAWGTARAPAECRSSSLQIGRPTAARGLVGSCS